MTTFPEEGRTAVTAVRTPDIANPAAPPASRRLLLPRLGSRRSPNARKRQGPLALLLIAPAGIGFVIFAAYPALRGVYLAFTSFYILSPAQWTGLANWHQLASDSIFWHSLITTVYFVTLSVVKLFALLYKVTRCSDFPRFDGIMKIVGVERINPSAIGLGLRIHEVTHRCPL